MASNLTAQVRNIAEVATPRSPVATCPRRSRSTSAAKILLLKDTLNTMVEQLRSFAAEVTRRRARSRHRGDASAVRRWCPASAARFKDLTDNVNLLARQP